MRNKQGGRYLLIALPLIFLFLFFYLPLLLVFVEGAALSGGVNVSGDSTEKAVWNVIAILKSPYYLKVISFTAFQALISTVFALAAGLPGSYILGRYNFPGKKVVKSLTTIPFVLPSILVVLGFVLFFGNNGHFNHMLMGLFNLKDPPLKILYSFKAIILAHGFYNFPIVMRMLSSAWENISRSQNEASKSLGAGNFFRFRTVTLHRLMPALLSAASLVFLFCFMSFAVILVLGGGPRYSTIEVEIYRLARFSLDFPQAASLGLIGTLFSMGLLSINLILQKRASVPPLGRGERIEPAKLLGGGKSKRKITPGGFLIVVYLVIAAVILLGPLLSVLVNSFQHKVSRMGETSWTLKWYSQLFTLGSKGNSGLAVRNSLVFGLLTILTALPLGTLIAFRTYRGGFLRSRIAEVLYMLPMGVSPVILGLGYLKMLPSLPEAVHGSWIVIVGAHTVIAYPFVIRAVSGALGAVPPSLRQAAASLGAGPVRVLFTIDLPLIKTGLLTGGAFAFALSLGEINATLLVADRSQITIPLAMYRLIGSYNFYSACVLGAILMILCGAAFFIIDTFQEKTI
ncbi:MAG: iron ABC transporter permease [Spirochaetales bacterium]|nr:iron ABC transporter permease [Spirochaetales bacterium]